MFKRRKFTLKFRKKYQFVDIGIWNEISDSSLLVLLFKLKEKYDFDIVSTNFKDSFNISSIVIKCNKEYKNKIFSEYCLALGGEIDNISF